MSHKAQGSQDEMVGVCPECDAQVPLGADPGLGQRAECPNCRARLTVINLNPLDLDWAFEEPLIRSVQEAAEDWAL